MAPRLCQYGNCGALIEPGEGIRINGAGYSVKFCSWIHAALWALSMAAQTAVSGDVRAALYRAIGAAADVIRVHAGEPVNEPSHPTQEEMDEYSWKAEQDYLKQKEQEGSSDDVIKKDNEVKG
jgi:hypothetical protein